MVVSLESMIAQAKSLRSKFTKDLLKGHNPKKEEQLSQFLTQLLQKPEVDIDGGSQGTIGSCLHQLFIAQQKVRKCLQIAIFAEIYFYTYLQLKNFSLFCSDAKVKIDVSQV